MGPNDISASSQRMKIASRGFMRLLYVKEKSRPYSEYDDCKVECVLAYGR